MDNGIIWALGIKVFREFKDFKENVKSDIYVNVKNVKFS